MTEALVINSLGSIWKKIVNFSNLKFNTFCQPAVSNKNAQQIFCFFSQIFQGCRRVFVRKSEFLSLISGCSVDVDIIRCAMPREPPYWGFRARQKQPHKK